MALACAMADDPSVLVLGEDVGVNGGVFRATDGLLARFGPERVLDTPLSEAADRRARRRPGRAGLPAGGRVPVRRASSTRPSTSSSATPRGCATAPAAG